MEFIEEVTNVAIDNIGGGLPVYVTRRECKNQLIVGANILASVQTSKPQGLKNFYSGMVRCW